MYVYMTVCVYRFDLSKVNLYDANLEKMNPADVVSYNTLVCNTVVSPLADLLLGAH